MAQDGASSIAMLGNDATHRAGRHTLVRNAPSRNELHLNDRPFHPCIIPFSQEQLAFLGYNFNVSSFPFPALYPSFAPYLRLCIVVRRPNTLLRIYGPYKVPEELGIAWSFYAISGLFHASHISLPFFVAKNITATYSRAFGSGFIERDRTGILHHVTETKDTEEAKGSERGGIPGAKCSSIHYSSECW